MPIAGMTETEAVPDDEPIPETVSAWPLRVALALGIAWFLYALHHVRDQPIIHDAGGYVALSGAMLDGRSKSGLPLEAIDLLFQIRLTGYPTFLLPFVQAGLHDQGLRVAVAVVQLAVHLAGVELVRRGLIRVLRRRSADRIAIGMLALPYPYFLSVEVLTDSLCISLAVICFGSILMYGSSTSGRAARLWAVAAIAATGAAMSMRVDGFHIAATCVAALISVRLGRPHGRSTPLSTLQRASRWVRSAVVPAVAVGAGIVLFRIPHFFILRRLTGHGSLQPPRSLVSFEWDYGVTMIKTATGIGNVPAHIYYRNPLLTDSAVTQFGSDASQWYTQHPAQAAQSVVLRWFALLDQDLPFVYNASVPGRPNGPLFLVNHAFVAIGLLGLALVISYSIDRRRDWSIRLLGVSFVVGGATWLATHAIPHVECRYGVPALMGLAGCAGYWLDRRRLRARWHLLVGAAVLYIPLAWWLSTWLIEGRYLSA